VSYGWRHRRPSSICEMYIFIEMTTSGGDRLNRYLATLRSVEYGLLPRLHNDLPPPCPFKRHSRTSSRLSFGNRTQDNLSLFSGVFFCSVRNTQQFQPSFFTHTRTPSALVPFPSCCRNSCFYHLRKFQPSSRKGCVRLFSLPFFIFVSCIFETPPSHGTGSFLCFQRRFFFSFAFTKIMLFLDLL
jgi:hypothetical protein